MRGLGGQDHQPVRQRKPIDAGRMRGLVELHDLAAQGVKARQRRGAQLAAAGFAADFPCGHDVAAGQGAAGLAGQSAQQGLTEHLPGDESRHRVARQSQPVRGPDPTDRHRLARLDRDAVDPDFAAQCQNCRAHVILFAHRDAAGGDDKIGLRRQIAHLTDQARKTVRGVRRGDQVHARRREAGGQHRRVHVPDLRGRARPTGAAQLVACDQQGGPRSAANGQGARAGRGTGGQVPRPQFAARVQNRRPLGHVAARAAYVLARRGPVAQAQDIPVAPGVFLHDHGVRADRDRRPGEDPCRRARRHRGCRRLPGGNARHHPQVPGPGARQRQGRDRVAIHGRIVEGRRRAPGSDRRRQNAAMGALERHGLGSYDRRSLCHDPGEGLVDADQRGKRVRPVTAAARGRDGGLDRHAVASCLRHSVNPHRRPRARAADRAATASVSSATSGRPA